MRGFQKQTLKLIMIIFATNRCRRNVESHYALRSVLLQQKLPVSGSLPCRTLQKSRPTVTSSLKCSVSLPKNHPENKAGAPCAGPLMRLLIGSPALKFSFKHIVKLFILISIIHTALHLLFNAPAYLPIQERQITSTRVAQLGTLSSDDFLPVVSPLLSVSSCCGVFLPGPSSHCRCLHSLFR